MQRPHYKPDLTVNFSPRVPRPLRDGIDRLARRHEMLAADVMHYGFEAALLCALAGKLRLREPTGDPPLDCMITFHTSRRFAALFKELHAREQERLRGREVLRAYVVRQLLESILAIAESKGMAHVMALREREIERLRNR